MITPLDKLFLPFTKEVGGIIYEDYELFDIGIVLVRDAYLNKIDQETITSKYEWEGYN